MLPLSGGILLFQGWRLDPILQFGQFLLVLGIIFESGLGLASDMKSWRLRTHSKP